MDGEFNHVERKLTRLQRQIGWVGKGIAGLFAFGVYLGTTFIMTTCWAQYKLTNRINQWKLTVEVTLRTPYELCGPGIVVTTVQCFFVSPDPFFVLCNFAGQFTRFLIWTNRYSIVLVQEENIPRYHNRKNTRFCQDEKKSWEKKKR
ncbi:hypothetical protein HOY80DRAFT_1136034, partial [Tuber brumale]